jgi:putative transposase
MWGKKVGCHAHACVGMIWGWNYTMAQVHRKKCKRYDIEGDAHHLTFSCFHGQPLFTKERSCLWMLDAFKVGRLQGKFDLWAYVIMPEHVHLVLLPHIEVKISQILTTLKQSVSKRAILWLQENSPEFLVKLEDIQPNGRRSYRFWQRGGGYDRNLRSVADIYEKNEYIHNNPVRRGLVQHACDWPWSSCRIWETGGEEQIAIDRESLPMLLPTE